MNRMVVGAALAALVATTGSVHAGPGPGAVGTPAVDFSLQEYGTGKMRSLSEYQGDVVLLFIVGYG